MNYQSLLSSFFSLVKGKRLCFYSVIGCMFFLFGLFLHPADAHKVNIFAYAQGGKIYAEGYFVDGTKCKNSVIEVVDGNTGEQLLEGKTDDNGQMSFPIPRVTALKLILHAGAGHQNDYMLTEEEVRDAMPAVKKQAERRNEQKKKAVPEQKQTKREQVARVENTIYPPVSSGELETVVEKVVDSKLQPVLKILLELQEKSGKPGVTEILGGIGYIIGILGIIAYYKGRRTNSKL